MCLVQAGWLLVIVVYYRCLPASIVVCLPHPAANATPSSSFPPHKHSSPIAFFYPVDLHMSGLTPNELILSFLGVGPSASASAPPPPRPGSSSVRGASSLSFPQQPPGKSPGPKPAAAPITSNDVLFGMNSLPASARDALLGCASSSSLPPSSSSGCAVVLPLPNYAVVLDRPGLSSSPTFPYASFFRSLLSEINVLHVPNLRDGRTYGEVAAVSQSPSPSSSSSSSSLSLSSFVPVLSGVIAGAAGPVRGDRSLFLLDWSSPSFQSSSPFLSSLLSCIRSLITSSFDQHYGGVVSLGRVSVQLATYGPGSGGYPLHCDVSGKCLSAEAAAAAAAAGGEERPDKQAGQEGGEKRLFTAVYYLGDIRGDEDDVEDKFPKPDVVGGELRLHHPPPPPSSSLSSSSSSSAAAAPPSFSPPPVDVFPLYGRLAIFRSDHVPHEVLPVRGGLRGALTLWFYGSVGGGGGGKTEQEAQKREGRSAADRSKPLPNVDRTYDKGGGGTLSSKSATIFVSIPSYRDPECQKTVRDLYAKASNPSRVYVGIASQHDTSNDAVETSELYGQLLPGVGVRASSQPQHHLLAPRGNVRLLSVHYSVATGPCYARTLSQSLYRGEEYVLNIDSHMRFRANWDSFLISSLEETHLHYHPAAPHESFPFRAIFTTYPPGYDLPDAVPAETRRTYLVPKCFNKAGVLTQKGVFPTDGVGGSKHGRDAHPDDGVQGAEALVEDLLRSKSSDASAKWGPAAAAAGDDDDAAERQLTMALVSPSAPYPLYAGGFAFSRAEVLMAHPYSPSGPLSVLHGVFFGEEVDMARRLFLSGVEFYGGPTTVVFHLWERGERSNFRENEGDQGVQRESLWREGEHSKNLRAIKGALEGDCGAAGVRTVKEFQEALGVEFGALRIL